LLFLLFVFFILSPANKGRLAHHHGVLILRTAKVRTYFLIFKGLGEKVFEGHFSLYASLRGTKQSLCYTERPERASSIALRRNCFAPDRNDARWIDHGNLLICLIMVQTIFSMTKKIATPSSRRLSIAITGWLIFPSGWRPGYTESLFWGRDLLPIGMGPDSLPFITCQLDNTPAMHFTTTKTHFIVPGILFT